MQLLLLNKCTETFVKRKKHDNYHCKGFRYLKGFIKKKNTLMIKATQNK